MASFPAGSDKVVNVATPMERVPVPSVADPFLNVTVSPSGGAPAPELTVAVNVTLCPSVIGFADEVRVVLVGAFFTVCGRPFDALPAKFAPPA